MASPRTEAQWMKWYEEIHSDDDLDSDLGEDVSDHSIHDTGTQQSADDEDKCTSVCWKGWDHMVEASAATNFWENASPESNNKTPRSDRRSEKQMKLWIARKSFSLRLSFSILNQKLDEIRPAYERPRDCLPTDLEEIMAFLGLLYLAGVKKGTAPEYK
ncbi:hypothetical protein NQ315_012745 [Exocentrus adspersus]|uniref:PiggyBac transposable element-derived protein domain-containing protein n=1 Tax=Exocentrus adspersus TaxID=1586481 RepID=A0AAV8V6H8_9CUCU|nr:hypothetical protein NQ315_012745 [Exocentrus adspersus]